MQGFRRGMSMLELMIALTILAAVLVAVLQALTAPRQLESLGAAQDEALLDTSKIIQVMGEDLAASGWYLPPPGLDPADPSHLRELSYLVRDDDRKLRYWPYVQQQAVNGGSVDPTLATVPVDKAGLSRARPYTHRTIDPPFPMLRTQQLPDVLPGEPGDIQLTTLYRDERERYVRSFHARSQELLFLKATVSAWRQIGDPDVSPVDSGSVPDRPQFSADGVPQPPALSFAGSDADWATPDRHGKLGDGGIKHGTGWRRPNPVTDPYTYEPRLRTKDLVPLPLPYGIVLDGGWFDAGDDQHLVKVQWETVDGSAYRRPAVGAGDDGYNPDVLREYQYAVIPSPDRNRMGRLVRAHKIAIPAGGAEPKLGYEVGDILCQPDPATDGAVKYRMQIDRVLSDDVVRVVFDTVRTIDEGAEAVTTLSTDQVRVRLYLARPTVRDPSLIVYRTAESVFTMRAINQREYLDEVEVTIGSAPIGFDGR